MVNNKIKELRGRLGEETNKLQLQEVAKLKAPYVQALQDIAYRQQLQHEAMQQPADYKGIPGYADGKDITGIVAYGQNKIPRYTLFGNPLANPIIPNIPKIKIGAQPDMLSTLPAPQGIPTPTPEVSIPGADEHGNTWNDEDKNPNINGIYKINNRDNLIASIAGMGMSLGQYLDAKGQDIRTPDIYAANPYERQALSTMANIRVSPYAAMNKVRDMNRVAARLINTSGGLSGGQKYSALVGSMLGTQRNMADVLTSTQAQNNQYRQQYAQLAGELGAKDAANRMAANQYNTEYAAKAHAARLQGIQQGMTNFLGQLQQYIANKNSADMYNGMRAIYQQDADTRAAALLNLNNNNTKAEYNGYKYMMPTANYYVNSPVQNPLTFGRTIPTTPFVKDSDLWLPPVRKTSVPKNGGNRRPRTKNKKR
ncbi:hypothetical protein KNV62_gp33 [uncultured phage cr273_1]|uniref:Uncharacterized protein n=1 Tax=uncultured phage cr273_1 TaxID=2772095 RepID=A0A7M1RU87_9CAUD|nr:hypothetical protein KNV62_gp33 [uncultured phage cr273_1]QOR57918.1 hypothetical protein [uncultured phage cr273_1]